MRMNFINKSHETILVLSAVEMAAFKEVLKLIWPNDDVGELQCMDLRTTKNCGVCFVIEVSK